MGDIKWVKFEVGMYDDTKLKILDSMENRDLYHYVWARSLVLAGKANYGGYLYITDNMPHTIKTLAIEFNRSIEEIKISFKILKKLEMIEFTADKVFRIKNWDKHQNVEGMERARQLGNSRVAKCRAKKKELNEKNKEAEINKDVPEIIEENKENMSKKIDNTDIKKDIDVSNCNSNEELNNKNIEDEINNIDITEDINDNKANYKCNITEAINENKTNNNSDATCNGNDFICNVTVTEQNKKKNKNKKEKKEIDKDINIESKKNACDLDNKTSTPDVNNKNSDCCEEVNQSSLFEQHKKNKCESEEEGDINLKAMDLMRYHEKITGKPGGCEYVALRSAIDIYGEKMVKMAMDIGFERNCPDIKYAIGVLKNWRRDGYPEDRMEVKTNGPRSNGKNISADKNEFAGFKPKEPRKLTDAERERIQANLI